jgi:crotonobetainyl-CoA:carnitine CoA-transferase CaiB-like acyl-CoA transferase
LLGEHTKAVLRKILGYDDTRIAALAEAGVFGTVPNDA